MMTPRPHRGLPSGRRRASRRGHWVWLVPSLVVVVAAAVAIPLTLTGDVHQRGGQPGHSTSASASTGSPTAPGAASWQVPRDESLDGRNSWVLNSYVAAHQVIVVSAQVIVGYDQHSGRRLWRVKPPPASGYRGDGPTIFCGTSSTLSGAMLAVAFGKRGQCALVAAIDVSAGRVAWISQILPPGTATALTLDAVLVEAAGPTVVIGFNDQIGAFNFGLPPGDFHRRWRAITDGHTLVTVTDARANRANKLVAVDTTTGKTRWSVSLGSAHVYAPFAIDGRQVLVAAATHAGSGALEAVRVDLATGKAVSATASTRAPFTGNPDLGAVTQFGWENGQVFGIPTTHATLLGPIEGPAAFALG
jgi:hypothetical protein